MSKIVIVKKKKKGHHAHHGGSWKVAYADFVTAMMAFFLVMWIMGMDQGTKNMVQGYFENPIGFQRGYSGGANILSQGNSITNLEVYRNAMLRRREEEAARLQSTAEEIQEAINASRLADGLDGALDVVVTAQGLRIEMMETSQGRTFFDVASAVPTLELQEVLGVVANELVALENSVVVEGHTDAAPFGRADYSNWELSVDRANSARRELVSRGLDPARMAEVRGFADRELKFPADPYDSRNRRVTLFLPFETPDAAQLDQMLLDAASRLQGLSIAGATP